MPARTIDSTDQTLHSEYDAAPTAPAAELDTIAGDLFYPDELIYLVVDQESEIDSADRDPAVLDAYLSGVPLTPIRAAEQAKERGARVFLAYADGDVPTARNPRLTTLLLPVMNSPVAAVAALSGATEGALVLIEPTTYHPSRTTGADPDGPGREALGLTGTIRPKPPRLLTISRLGRLGLTPTTRRTED